MVQHLRPVQRLLAGRNGRRMEDKAKTAFCTKYVLFQFNVMPFGLCNVPGMFERLMETVLRGMQWEGAVLYLDYIIIFSETIESICNEWRKY